MILKLSNINLDAISDKLRASAHVVSVRKMKDSVSFVSKTAEGIIEDNYKAGIDQVADLLRGHNRLPRGASTGGAAYNMRLTGAKSIHINYAGHTEDYIRRQKHGNEDTYWLDSGLTGSYIMWRASSNRGFKLKDRKFKTVYRDKKKRIQVGVSFKAATMYSSKLNKMFNEPFFDPYSGSNPYSRDPTAGIGMNSKSYIDIAYYTEQQQPLIRPIMQSYGINAIKSIYKVVINK